jgi:hypothetical protein
VRPARTGAISISSASSPQCRLTSSAAFPLTASDVLPARLYCLLGGFAPNRRAAASPHPRARLHAAASPELRSSTRLASHVPQLLHTGASLFLCRSTPSRQYYAVPPPAFARLRAITCCGLTLAPHACTPTASPAHHCSLRAARLRPGLAPAALARVLYAACSRRPTHALRKPPAPASASSCSLPVPLCAPVRLLPRTPVPQLACIHSSCAAQLLILRVATARTRSLPRACAAHAPAPASAAPMLAPLRAPPGRASAASRPGRCPEPAVARFRACLHSPTNPHLALAPTASRAPAAPASAMASPRLARASRAPCAPALGPSAYGRWAPLARLPDLLPHG